MRFRRRRADLWVGVLASATLVLAGLAFPLVAAEPARATVPGLPGTPQPPTPLFTEDFSHVSASAGAVAIESYQGAPGTVYVPGSSGASSETYYADPNWRMAAHLCNGFILNGSTPVVAGDPCAGSAPGLGFLKQITNYIGQFQGMTTAAAAQNQALASWTWTNPSPGPGVQFRTVNPIPAVDGHFYRVTAVFGEANCTVGDAQERFSLIVNGALVVLASGLDPCTAPGAVPYVPPIQNANLPTMVVALTTPARKVNGATPGATPTVGMELYNAQGTGGGNDVVFDLPQIMDVTPQLDKAFSPSTIASGQTSTLTFAITNTNELGAKTGIGFHDNLPAGLTATGVNSTTCTNGVVTGAAGATTVALTGAQLNQGVNSCTVTVQVTATTPGTYTNGPANFPAGVAGLDGLNPPADTSLTVTAPASLNLAKTTKTEAISTVGQVVTYRFLLTNNGPTTVSNIVVTDTQVPPASQAGMSPITCQTTTLAPDASTTCVGTYTVTQADLDNGSLVDKASASGTDAGGGAVMAPEVTLKLGTPQPSISIVKSTTTNLVSAVGQPVPYTFHVTNTGNLTLLNVGVTDTQTPPASQGNLSAISCPQSSLAPGVAEDCTATYTATLADLQNRTVNDSATASGTTNAGAKVTSAPSTLSIPSQPPGSLTIKKSTTTAAVPKVGQPIPYTYTVTNNSAVPVSNVRVTDTVDAPSLPANLSPVTCQALTSPSGACSGTSTTLAAGQSATFTGTYQTTQADVNAGRIGDSAVASGTDPGNNPVQSGSSRVELLAATASMTIAKTTSVTSVSAVGQQVPYTFTVTNTGNQTLTSVHVNDTQVAPASPAGMSAITCQALTNPAGSCSGANTTLLAGQVATFTGTYTVSQADLSNGSVNDFAVAAGTSPDSAAVTSPQSSSTVNTSTTPLSMVKSVAEDLYRTIGQVVHYTFVVTNNSSTAYHGIQIQDTQVPPATQGNLSNVSCAQTTLQAGESTTCSATYTVTAADITNGTLGDYATATGLDLGNNTVTTARSSAILPAQQNAALDLTKSSTTVQITAVGEQVPYAFTVRNSGNVTVTSVQVADTQSPPASQGNMSTVTCPPGALDPGASVVCTGTYTVTQADLDHGSLNDTAVASASSPSGPVSSPQATLTITANPALTILKSSTTAQITTVGQQVPYTFVVTNIRQSTVTNVQVTDTQLAPASQASMSAILCDATTLAAGASTTCHGTYTATAADIANGSVNDSATASGTDASGLPLPPSTPSSLAIPTAPAPALTVAKSSSASVITAVGQTVTYRFVVTNSGNTVIGSIGVTDTVTPPASQGNLSPMSCPYPTLDPGASETCTATYTVTQADIDHGSVGDSAVATGTGPGNAPVQSPPSTLDIPAPAPTSLPALSIVKSSTLPGIVTLNQQVPYTFVVTNNGATTLTGVSVQDTQLSPAVQANLSSVLCQSLSNPVATCSGTSVTLAAGQSARFTANYTTTQPDFDNGRVDDSAIAVGTSGGTQVTSSPSVWSVPVDPLLPVLTVRKSSTTTVITAVGQQVPYTFHVTNTGNQTLSNITVTDTVVAPSIQSNLSPIVCPPGTLAPGASVDCTAIYTATGADLNSPAIADSAVAHGTTPANRVMDSTVSRVSIPTDQEPSFTMVKSSTTTSVTAVGEQIPYTFTVTNTGNVTLTGVSVTDTVAAPGNLTAVTCESLSNPADTCSGTSTSLAAGQVATFTATYTVTQGELDAGVVNDSALAQGTPTGATTPIITPASVVAIPVAQSGTVTVVKSSTTGTITQIGQQVPYTFTVTNTGNVTLSSISVTDTVASPSDPANLSPVNCPSGVLTPGASVECTATYTVTAADLDAGGTLRDTAGATATAAGGAAGGVTGTSGEYAVPIIQTPLLTVVKSSTTGTITQIGQQVPYTFTVTNTGNVTLSSISVTDTVASPSDPANLSPVNCPSGEVIPGASVECTATYTVTAADLDAGGTLRDTAHAAATAPGGAAGAVTGSSDEYPIPVIQTPGLAVVKSSTTTIVTAAGQEVPYTFTVTNTGNVTLTGVSVTDTVAAPGDLSAVTCQSLSNPDDICSGTSISLAAGQVATFVATYAATQAEVDAGSIDDSAVAHGVPPGSPTPITSGPSLKAITVQQSGGLEVVKSSTTFSVDAAGQTIPYTYAVTNTGNVTLSGVTVTDTVTPPSNPANLSAVTCVQLTNPSGSCSGSSTTLAPGQTATFSATYLTTAADMDNGWVRDTAAANGETPLGAPVQAVDSLLAIPAPAVPALTTVKSTTTTSVSAVGQKIPYTFTVTNTGNVTIDGVAVTDTVGSSSDPANLTDVTCVSLSNPVASCSGTTAKLAMGQVATFTATYTVTQADLNNGSVNDSAIAGGTSVANQPVTSAASTASVAVTQSPHLSIAKSSSTSVVTRVGQEVLYTFIVTNDGNVTLSDVSVSDAVSAPSDPASLSAITCISLSSPAGTCSGTAVDLEPGQGATFTATYTTTQADIAHGTLVDSASASGIPPATPENPTPAPIPTTQPAGLTIPVSLPATPPTQLPVVSG